MRVQISLWERDFISFRYIPRSGFLHHMVVLNSIFWGFFILFSIMVYQFTFLLAVHKRSLFSTASPTILQGRSLTWQNWVLISRNHKNSASLNPELEAFGENLLLNSFFLLVKFSSLQLEDWVPNFLASCQQKLLLFPRCHLHSLTFYLVKLHVSDGMSNPSTTSNLSLLGEPSPF